jgi:hypothetical protein
MRYPLVAFLFVFLLGPYTAHAMLTGAARIETPSEAHRGVLHSGAFSQLRQLGDGVLVAIRQQDLVRPLQPIGRSVH